MVKKKAKQVKKRFAAKKEPVISKAEKGFFERFKDIILAKKEVLIINKPSMPRIITIEENYKFKDLIKQKERTALARKQLAVSPTGKKFYSFNFFHCFN